MWTRPQNATLQKMPHSQHSPAAIARAFFSGGKLLLLCSLVACQSADTVSLTIFLRTDYQPIRDFINVEVLVDRITESSRADISAEYVNPGKELATFSKLATSERRSVVISLIDAQQTILGTSTVVIEHVKDLVLTVSITRDCGGVVCEDKNGRAQRCLDGQCVDARCASGQETFCLDANARCDTNDDCSTSSPCARPTCVHGVCFDDTGTAAMCDVGTVCDFESGCVPDPDTCTTADSCSRRSECIPTSCVENLCIYRLAASGTLCDGGQSTCQQGVCQSADCANGVKDNDETDVDCGGSCTACDDGGVCNLDTDCKSMVCDDLGSGTCEAADTCGNGKIESGESCDDGDIVAGDGCSDSCKKETNQACTRDAECQSALCLNTCADGISTYTKAGNPGGSDLFGYSLDLEGDLLAVGAFREDSCNDGINTGPYDEGCAVAGAVYVYSKDSGDWELEATIKASNSDAGDEFGRAVSLSGNRLAIGARYEDSCSFGLGGNQADNACSGGKGAVYIFERSAMGVWSQDTYVKPEFSDTDSAHQFGAALSLDGTRLAVGSPGAHGCTGGINPTQSTAGCNPSGTVSVLNRTGPGSWVQDVYFKSPSPSGIENFGSQIMLTGDQVLVGDASENSCAIGVDSDHANAGCASAGAAYVFVRSMTGTWSQQGLFKAVQHGRWRFLWSRCSCAWQHCRRRRTR